MRAEVFAKDTQSLVTASRLLLSVGARGINVPNKATVAQNPELAPAAALHEAPGSRHEGAGERGPGELL